MRWYGCVGTRLPDPRDPEGRIKKRERTQISRSSEIGMSGGIAVHERLTSRISQTCVDNERKGNTTVIAADALRVTVLLAVLLAAPPARRVMGPWLPAFPRRSGRFAPYAPQSRLGGPATGLPPLLSPGREAP